MNDMLATLWGISIKLWPAVPALIAMDGLTKTFPYGTFTASAALVWYLWYTTCKSNPAIEKRHTEQFQAQRQAHDKQFHSQLEFYERMLLEEKSTRKEEVDKFDATLNRFCDVLETTKRQS